MNIEKYIPSVSRKILILVAGIIWCSMGLMLVCFAYFWLLPLSASGRIIYYSTGFLASMPIHHFGFLKIADKNLHRLLPVAEKRSIFSFMTLKSYLIVFIMISLGITLRHSAIPKRYLSILYNGIGLALFLSGIRYFRYFLKLTYSKKESNQ